MLDSFNFVVNGTLKKFHYCTWLLAYRNIRLVSLHLTLYLETLSNEVNRYNNLSVDSSDFPKGMSHITCEG